MYAIRVITAIVLFVCLGQAIQHPRTTLHRSEAHISAAEWKNAASDWIEKRLSSEPIVHKASSLIMFLGDGMSIPTISAARALKGQRNGKTGEEETLAFEDFPTVGLVKTYCADAQIADSACSATAYLGGAKTNYGTIGVDDGVARGDCSLGEETQRQVHSIANWALDAGMDVGIVTTTRITHASPAGAYAHTADRDWESDAELLNDCEHPNQADIAYQLIHHHPATKFKVILGGGRRNFRPNGTVDEQGNEGSRLDGRDLISEWNENNIERNLSHSYVWNRHQLLEAASQQAPLDRLLGLFASSHLKFNLERSTEEEEEEPTLEEMTIAAIQVLKRNPRGYFLFVEGGRIDQGHHETRPLLALDETLQMEKAVERARQDDPEALIVVTADHAHTMTYNGYSSRGNDILGASERQDEQGVPYMTLSYANGPGFRAHVAEGVRQDVTKQEDYQSSIYWRSHADAPLASETHGGDDVALFASGPHHQLFSGVYEQSHIPYMMAYAACIGPGPHFCREPVNYHYFKP